LGHIGLLFLLYCTEKHSKCIGSVKGDTISNLGYNPIWDVGWPNSTSMLIHEERVSQAFLRSTLAIQVVDVRSQHTSLTLRIEHLRV